MPGSSVLREVYDGDADIVPRSKEVKAMSYGVKRSHPLYKELAGKYGVIPGSRVRRRAESESSGSDGI